MKGRDPVERNVAADESVDVGACVGTFRWANDKTFPSIASLCCGRQMDQIDDGSKRVARFDKGWPGFIVTRCGDVNAIVRSQRDLSIIDGLSFPCSAIFALEKLGLKAHCKGELDIVILGATYKAEVRILEETDYWSEIGRHLNLKLRLWFVGPELRGPKGVSSKKKTSKKKQKGNYHFFQGTACAFFKSHPELLSDDNQNQLVLIGFNPGFGSGCKDLLESWLTDLKFIADNELTCIFTQANDFSDLRGEVTILRRLLNVRFLLKPQKNPFHMAMTACEDPSKPESSSWSCGNSFLYCFKGSADLGKPVDPKRVTVVCKLLQSFYKDIRPYSPESIRLGENELRSITSDIFIAKRKGGSGDQEQRERGVIKISVEKDRDDVWELD